MAHQLTAKQFSSFQKDLDGISKRTMEEHYKLYQGYVNKYNEITTKLEALTADDYKAANPTYSLVRELKVELARAVGGVKNHELYFNHLGGKGGAPGPALAAQIEKDFGSFDKWLSDFKATGAAARGWAFLAWDREYNRLFNMIGDEQFSFPVWNATPILAMDVFEHAFFIDFGAAKAAYIEKFFANLAWSDVEKHFAEAK
ncbi:MAG: Fe-Mn family superoxide dismutase, partial [Chloroflexota bacterium]